MGKSAYEGAKPGGDTNFRKEWNKEEYEQKAKERQAQAKKNNEEKGAKSFIDMSKSGFAVARDDDLGLDANINKTVVITAENEFNGPGFHCATCNVVYKDNLSYLDHLNSPEHLQKAGLSNRVARSTIEQVRARLKARKERDAAPKDPKITFEERIKKEALEKEQKKEAKKQKKAQEKQMATQGFIDDQVNSMMGFGAFGSSK